MSQRKTNATEFGYHAPYAGAVLLAGTFNDWKTGATLLTKGDQGN